MQELSSWFRGRHIALIVSVVCGLPPATLAGDRIQMVGPPPSDEIVKSLTESLESTCNSRNVPGFLRNFTSERANEIRRRIEDLFVCHDLALDIREAFVLRASDSEIVFGVRYELDDRESVRMVLASRVTARKIEGAWLVDSEEVLNVKEETLQGTSGSGPITNIQRKAAPFAGKPDWIPRDLGWIPGGCEGGRCGL